MLEFERKKSGAERDRTANLLNAIPFGACLSSPRTTTTGRADRGFAERVFSAPSPVGSVNPQRNAQRRSVPRSRSTPSLTFRPQNLVRAPQLEILPLQRPQPLPLIRSVVRINLGKVSQFPKSDPASVARPLAPSWRGSPTWRSRNHGSGRRGGATRRAHPPPRAACRRPRPRRAADRSRPRARWPAAAR